MQKCKLCGGNDFYKEAGYFFCVTCQTQNEDVREEVLELRYDPMTRLRKTRIKRTRSEKSGEELGWTSWELYNFVLIGLTNELIELGVPADIKLTILQLWATYLGKIEVAFTSTRKKCVPRLARKYNRRDAEIIYGKVQAQKKSRKRRRTGSSTNTSMFSDFQSEGSSFRELNKSKRLLINAEYDKYLQSQASTEGDGVSAFSQSLYSVQSSSVKSSDNEGKIQYSSHAKDEINKVKNMSRKIPRSKRARYKEKHTSTQYKIGPSVITPMRLWAILYIALRLHNQSIHLGDMLRYGREGHLSYYKLDHLLPPEITLTKSDINLLSQNVEITHKGMRRIVASMAKFLGVSDLICPDLMPLINRYCQELGLPRGILLYTERLIALSPPKMRFDEKKSYIPNYEGRAMAYIIVVLKILFALDGITEYQISRVAEKISGCERSIAPRIIVHGGAGNCDDSIIIEKITACKKAAANGYKKLMHGKSAIEAVETTLWWLECDEFFNCSYGSALNETGNVQMDASIMDGLSLKCGSVAAVADIEHPISLAKHVLQHHPNSIFLGEGVKELAKEAKFNWLSEGNMIAPTSYLTYKLTEPNNDEDETNPEISQTAKIFTDSLGTVGCVAFDGCGIAAGTTTGGLNRKLVGRVGDSPFLGCGTFANKTAGCSLTGHGESIMRHGLSRAVVEDIENDYPLQEALSKNLSHMYDTLKQTGGGIVLHSNGSWASFSTSNTMPYAVIADDFIFSGATLNDRKSEVYFDYDKRELCGCNVAIERGLLDAKLFDFQEWQKYIECRKTILVHSHFPTKLKYSCDTHGIDGLYIKFLDFINSKGERTEPEITAQRNFLPEDLVDAMKKHIFSLSGNDIPPKEIDFFAPSLTPLHSYLQQLLSDPLNTLPRVVHNDFFFTKVGYMTKPYSLLELAKQCEIELDIIDSNLHFLEKFVPPFEQARMPSVDELKKPVEVEDQTNADEKQPEKIKSFSDYVHRKTPCRMKLNVKKEQYYDRVTNSMSDFRNSKLGRDFAFTEVLPDGRLAIPNDSDSEVDDKETILRNTRNTERLLDPKFRDKYNLRLLHMEKESIARPESARKVRLKRRIKLEPERNSKGHFIKSEDEASVKVEDSESEDDPFSTINNFIDEEFNEIKNDQSLMADDVDIDGALGNLTEVFNLSQISFLCDDQADIKTEIKFTGKLQFFRPFKDYWMYHCIFSRVKPKNFEVFEKSLPISFRWLLHECAHIVEMTEEDLYEEICLIESYHAYILKPTSLQGDKNLTNLCSKIQQNLILSKW